MSSAGANLQYQSRDFPLQLHEKGFYGLQLFLKSGDRTAVLRIRSDDGVVIIDFHIADPVSPQKIRHFPPHDRLNLFLAEIQRPNIAFGGIRRSMQTQGVFRMFPAEAAPGAAALFEFEPDSRHHPASADFVAIMPHAVREAFRRNQPVSFAGTVRARRTIPAVVHDEIPDPMSFEQIRQLQQPLLFRFAPGGAIFVENHRKRLFARRVSDMVADRIPGQTVQRRLHRASYDGQHGGQPGEAFSRRNGPFPARELSVRKSAGKIQKIAAPGEFQLPGAERFQLNRPNDPRPEVLETDGREIVLDCQGTALSEAFGTPDKRNPGTFQPQRFNGACDMAPLRAPPRGIPMQPVPVRPVIRSKRRKHPQHETVEQIDRHRLFTAIFQPGANSKIRLPGKHGQRLNRPDASIGRLHHRFDDRPLLNLGDKPESARIPRLHHGIPREIAGTHRLRCCMILDHVFKLQRGKRTAFGPGKAAAGDGFCEIAQVNGNFRLHASRNRAESHMIVFLVKSQCHVSAGETAVFEEGESIHFRIIIHDF